MLSLSIDRINIKVRLCYSGIHVHLQLTCLEFFVNALLPGHMVFKVGRIVAHMQTKINKNKLELFKIKIASGVLGFWGIGNGIRRRQTSAS